MQVDYRTRFSDVCPLERERGALTAAAASGTDSCADDLRQEMSALSN